ncbi:uncharacterized protein LOC116211916 [Punica granatum]|uniref:Uncharacterized protein n=2 Tax=Punica granatum TaxID=22663 RepID=A0A218W7N4_PUNGR|nr:uncharacterized protein LOC116211916 [Punica granatum]OWM68330.1 hypothetical protein CDL15_Pgr004812 [Punica granatum]PKI57037.1 hypothetical protein CRG98_022541 [Punica granatum]
MEANVCDVNQLDADVLLPPRKRLLAGLKKQSCDADCSLNGSFTASPSSPSMFDARLNNLLSSHTNNPDLSPEEIAEASRTAAEAATRAARAARATAEEKAAIAARAVAAAKSALDLVASFSEDAASKDSYLRKNKLKKHVHVNSLYKKYRPVENCKTDEELARKLHRVINSSPRISKISSSSGSRGHKHKKLRISFPQDKIRVSDEDTESERERDSPKCNGQSVSGDAGPDDSPSERGIKYIKPFGQSEMENGESSHSKEKLLPGDASPNGKRRGRVKLKKLPLSNCAFRDETTGTKSYPVSEPRTGNGLFSNGSSSDSLPLQLETAAAPIWKCQDFHAPTCVKQNKVAQS